MHLRVIDWRGGVFYGAYRNCFGVRVYAVYLFICCAERVPARDTFENAGGCAAVYGVGDDSPRGRRRVYCAQCFGTREVAGFIRHVPHCVPESDKRPGDRRDYPQTCAKIPVCGDWGFSNTKECSIIEA